MFSFLKKRSTTSNEEKNKKEEIKTKKENNEHNLKINPYIDELIKFGILVKKFYFIDNNSYNKENLSFFIYDKENLLSMKDLYYFTLDKKLLSFLLILKNLVFFSSDNFQKLNKVLDKYSIDKDTFLEVYKEYLNTLNNSFINKINDINFEEYLVLNENIETVINNYSSLKEKPENILQSKKYFLDTLYNQNNELCYIVDYEKLLDDFSFKELQIIIKEYENKTKSIVDKIVYKNKYALIIVVGEE
jgi:hypothetical protein